MQWHLQTAGLSSSTRHVSHQSCSAVKSIHFSSIQRPIAIPAAYPCFLPARLPAAMCMDTKHMVSINMNVLTGLGPPTNVYGDHALSEVYLGGRWLLVDSYTIDPQLYKAGLAAVHKHGLCMGYGVHANGVNEWDGTDNSFVQYVMPSETQARPGSGSDRAFSATPAAADGPASDSDFGLVQDLRHFCQDVGGSPFASLRSGLGGLAFGVLGSRYCNRQIQRLRSAGVA